MHITMILILMSMFSIEQLIKSLYDMCCTLTTKFQTFLIYSGTKVGIHGILLLASLLMDESFPQKKYHPAIEIVIKTIHYQASKWWTVIDQAISSMKTKRQRRYTATPIQTRNSPTKMICKALIFAMTAQTKSIEECGPFDTDSELIGIDNRCSGCITHTRTDIPGEITECRRSIKGFGGERTYKVWTGTIHWTWDDDNGKQHKMVIPNAYYVPDGGVRLLSPQHWAQQRSGKDRQGGAGSTTMGTHVELFWNNRDSRRTVPIDLTGNNVATFRLSSGYNRFAAYCMETGLDNEVYQKNPLTIDETTMISDDDSDDDPETESEDESQGETPDPAPDEESISDSQPRQFDLNGPTTAQDKHQHLPTVITDEEDRQGETPAAELLRIHYDFGHTSFSKLQQMAKHGVIPYRLRNCAVPVCSACQYAKATRRPWRSRSIKDRAMDQVPTEPGQIIAIDQLVSPIPGLIAQMIGFITKERYKIATVYVDTATGYGFVYPQKTASAAETLEGKRVFEKQALDNNIKIQAYHADNGIFKAKAWVDDCTRQGQRLTFAAAGAHHTNGKAERRIRELQELARTTLIHAQQRWPKAITANLWPYAVRYANFMYQQCTKYATQIKEESLPTVSQYRRQY